MDADAPATENLVTVYLATLQTKAPSTIDAYARVLRQITAWIAQRPGSDGRFQPDQLTVTALDTYLKDLAARWPAMIARIAIAVSARRVSCRSATTIPISIG